MSGDEWRTPTFRKNVAANMLARLECKPFKKFFSPKFILSTNFMASEVEGKILPANKDHLIKVGKHYMVRRKGNQIIRAEVIHCRFNCHTVRKEYYVHYESLDRRLDQWIPCSQIISLVSESSSDESLGKEENDDLFETEVSTRRRTKMLAGHTAATSAKQKNANIDDVEKEHKELTKVKYVDCIQFGIYEINTWYFSPYPEDFGKQSKLFICEFCLKYMMLEKSYRYHMAVCKRKHPPGKQIYRKGTLAIYETDPAGDRFDRVYCQNLCLLAKLFIDHKTVFFDVDQFLFYVLCEVDKCGSHMVGYFSKEKESPDGNNLACLLTLPPFQRKGYGKLLISLSYELSKLQGVIGSPEKPLSDLGKLSYRSYWSWVLLDILLNFKGVISIRELSERTSITPIDIVSTLNSINILKYWDGNNTICVTPRLIEDYTLSPKFKRPRLTVDTNDLTWTPSPAKSASSNNLSDCEEPIPQSRAQIARILAHPLPHFRRSPDLPRLIEIEGGDLIEPMDEDNVNEDDEEEGDPEEVAGEPEEQQVASPSRRPLFRNHYINGNESEDEEDGDVYIESNAEYLWRSTLTVRPNGSS